MSKNSDVIKIAIAESSVIIRSGLAMALKRLPHLRIQPIEISIPSGLNDCMKTQMPDILIINPNFGHFFDIASFEDQYHADGLKIVALVNGFVDETLLKKYNETISIHDNLDLINDKIIKLRDISDDSVDNDTDLLSHREKEIVVCVIKGLTNKEIAEQLFISIHTVITHRKNISKKLQIHSVAGLTIYAIVNKLVELNDVKNI